ncbi:gas vesicle protein [Pseudonocardia endophytica]|uniref:Gas vesicle protein GvpA/GvpJ/GvpM family n=1 Tax=Pseudonocardia endophytica TaxID=401976 RepID=A0A4R1HKT5_PSEEN|nr:gas vesicle protein [Pseudonocardia endophytica]TCK21593.1 gas vesicle protein GvpA/GvpJ/GvpM family [Pseudonocardia endophytica]
MSASPDITGGLLGDREVALVDLLDRVLSSGVVLAGDVTISLAGVDLIRISLRALVTSIAPADTSIDPPPVEWTNPPALEARTARDGVR